MADYAEERRSELEVLESIFSDELEVLSDERVSVRVEPEVQSERDPHTLSLVVTYTPTYPDEPPELEIEVAEGEVSEEEEGFLLEGLRTTAEENLGMAMVYTLALQLKELIAEMLVRRKERIAREDEERYRREEEAVAAKKRGTPVTKESFSTWVTKFEFELAEQRRREEEERIKALPPKEREEARRWAAKLTGRQLFEQGKVVDSDAAAFGEEGDVAIDVSQYERREGTDEEEDEVVEAAGRLRLADLSDDE
ncbi:RWD domain containing protein [Rhodotorula toruloides]|uniref:RWD domain containing protein n=1 Tax=Rhodotorula toruloides TaxID=5286 RepID=A0A511KQH3_RHOTO|nr:RWD domain containing protein [Rhodotorula toruloides]